MCSVCAPFRGRPEAQGENRLFCIARTRCRKRKSLCFQFTVVFPSWHSMLAQSRPCRRTYSTLGSYGRSIRRGKSADVGQGSSFCSELSGRCELWKSPETVLLAASTIRRRHFHFAAFDRFGLLSGLRVPVNISMRASTDSSDDRSLHLPNRGDHCGVISAIIQPADLRISPAAYMPCKIHRDWRLNTGAGLLLFTRPRPR